MKGCCNRGSEVNFHVVLDLVQCFLDFMGVPPTEAVLHESFKFHHLLRDQEAVVPQYIKQEQILDGCDLLLTFGVQNHSDVRQICQK